METAQAIKDVCGVLPFIFRAGVWKPRTRPDTFQGVGEEGLTWLAEVKERFGIPVATEVANPKHVEAALKAGIDYLWIGARTSANPLAVQGIAEAINAASQQCNAPKALLIKNPVNADAALWLGNIERLEKAVKGLQVTGDGIPVIAVHRGCNHQPCWSMAHAVRLARPDIPMLLDPSHLSGNASQVPELLKKVPELGLNGAMVEVHVHPETALSDAKQQISPKELNAALGCCVNAPKEQCKAAPPQLSWLRAEMDELDEQLWDTIAARMDISRRIGEWKKAHGVAPLQPERYIAKSEELKVKSEELGLPKDFVKHIYDLIHEESVHQQS